MMAGTPIVTEMQVIPVAGGSLTLLFNIPLQKSFI